MLTVLSDDERLQQMIDGSFRNFHTKGLDYLCLKRSDDLTVKVYFFDGPCVNAGEIVYPHNHRYDFATTVLAGYLHNKTWRETAFLKSPVSEIRTYNRFEYHTPLNGGDGFKWQNTVRLKSLESKPYTVLDRYICGHDEIHTLAHVAPGTVIALLQYPDVIPIGKPTVTYSLNHEPPSLSGLYEKHTPDQIIDRLRQLERISPELVSKYAPQFKPKLIRGFTLPEEKPADEDYVKAFDYERCQSEPA